MIESIRSFISCYIDKSPIVIHCRYLLFNISAGIGRSGTFIAIYNILSCLEKLREITQDLLFCNVFNTVRKLREQRIKMVTTVEQYLFIYNCIIKWVNKIYLI